MPSIWYHLMTPPVKSCGCWAGTGCPFTFLWGCSRCLALSRTLSDRRFLMSWLESLIFSISSACSFFPSSWNQMFNTHVRLNVLRYRSTAYLSIKCNNTSIIPSASLGSFHISSTQKEKIKIRWSITVSSTFVFLACDIISWKTKSSRNNVSNQQMSHLQNWQKMKADLTSFDMTSAILKSSSLLFLFLSSSTGNRQSQKLRTCFWHIRLWSRHNQGSTQSGLCSVTVSLTFTPKNQCVWTGKVISEHSLRVTITTYCKLHSFLYTGLTFCKPLCSDRSGVFCDDAASVVEVTEKQHRLLHGLTITALFWLTCWR